MARYLAVVPVQTEGRRVPLAAGTVPPSEESDDFPPEIPPGTRLVAVVNNGEWQTAMDVTHRDAFERLLRRCRNGVWREMQLYLLDEERAAQIEDGRRVLMNGEPVKDPGRLRPHRRSS